jgi:hypothetical protein
MGTEIAAPVAAAAPASVPPSEDGTTGVGVEAEVEPVGVGVGVGAEVGSELEVRATALAASACPPGDGWARCSAGRVALGGSLWDGRARST